MNSDVTGEKGFDLSLVVLKMEDTTFSRILGDYWTKFSFRIMKWPENDHSYSEEALFSLGKLEVLKLNYAYAVNHEPNLLEMFDGDYRETVDCYAAVFDNEEHFRKPFRDENSSELFEDLITDIHILNRITIDEQFKGYGVTGEASRIYFERFASGQDVYYVKAFPLQYEGDDTHPQDDYPRKFKGTFRSCQSKLCRYYEKLGFRRIGKSPHFFGSVGDFLFQHQKLTESTNEVLEKMTPPSGTGLL